MTELEDDSLVAHVLAVSQPEHLDNLKTAVRKPSPLPVAPLKERETTDSHYSLSLVT